MDSNFQKQNIDPSHRRLLMMLADTLVKCVN